MTFFYRQDPRKSLPYNVFGIHPYEFQSSTSFEDRPNLQQSTA